MTPLQRRNAKAVNFGIVDVYKRQLPKIDMGDLLVIHDTGAHGFAMGYNYNGKLKSAEVLLKEDGTAQLIRRAETPKDYFATFDCFDIGKKLVK